MRDEPLISIALCTYNGEKYIGQQLESILSQTCRNLEVVIVDDCSTDGTIDIVNGYAKKDARIKCFVNETNLGFNKNFERAITLTTGEYIAISDQDDIWLPEKIESLLNNIGDNWLIFSNSSYLGGLEEGKILDGDSFKAKNYKGTLLTNFVTGHTTLFKREFIDYILPFASAGFYDWWMAFVALYHQKIVFLDKILTQYRIHNDSVTQSYLSVGQERQKELIVIDQMLSAFATYKHLEDTDRKFIIKLQEAYRRNLPGSPVPLVKIIFDNYADLFTTQKNRKGLSRLNFAFKYAGQLKKNARL